MWLLQDNPGDNYVQQGPMGRWTNAPGSLPKVQSKKKNWKENVDDVLLAVVDKNKFKTGDFFMSLRITVFSSNATPSINDSIKFIGKKETLERIERMLKSR